MDWIHSYTVEKFEDCTILSGPFSASGGTFEIKYKGDGGNADTFEITLKGGQYDTSYENPMQFTITGAWEIREVTDMFKLLEQVKL